MNPYPGGAICRMTQLRLLTFVCSRRDLNWMKRTNVFNRRGVGIMTKTLNASPTLCRLQCRLSPRFLSNPAKRLCSTFAEENMWRRLILIGTLGALAGLFVIPLNPVQSKIQKLAFLGCIAGAWVGLAMLTWNRKPLRMVALMLPWLAAIPFLLPPDRIDAAELRENYVRRMAEFEGTKYFWGGESHRGIDCSGLPRRALRDALLAYGVRHLNGRAFRSYLEHWWFDASAKALGAGYRDFTIPLGIKGTIRDMDYAGLVPGDLAVTTSGVHILAYAGDGQWIQADPSIGTVATLPGRTDKNAWFRMPVTTHRWQLLAPRSSNSEQAGANH